MATRPDTTSVVRPTVPILGLLGLAFVIMKLAHIGAVASWSWWWVTAPFWGPVAVFAAIWGVAVASVAIGLALLRLNLWWEKKREEPKFSKLWWGKRYDD